jgi:YHS domain-containing protein
MKLIYRGVTYDRRPSESIGRPFQPVREVKPVKVPESLAVHKLIYRGTTYYRLSHQSTTFLVNAY